MTNEHPKSDLVAAATNLVELVDKGDSQGALNVLEQAAIGLRDVVTGHVPDQERVIYLQFLLRSLDQILSGVPPEKALGIWTDTKPRLDPWRDTALFLLVGEELDRASNSNSRSERPVTTAIKAVATKKNIGFDTVKDAWENNGAKKGWTEVRELMGK